MINGRKGEPKKVREVTLPVDKMMADRASGILTCDDVPDAECDQRALCTGCPAAPPAHRGRRA
jgi:hypothetical protein